ncbi:MAG TPA: TraR/DksA C4-type zinc finger protein [Actinospica sp.]|nr:TraR/DksA C4-type zinc finger protein [Actinospica sp.]
MERAGNGRSGLRWRVILEARWRDRLQDVTELSLAYHTATPDGEDSRHARRLLRRAVAARQRLADTEDALHRIAAGTFGRCEQCETPISEVVLAAAPECRYCGRCASSAPAGSSTAGTALTA